jgi:phage FluMu protein Com
MKNLVYTGVIAGCILVAAVVFLATRSGGGSGIDSIPDTQMAWVRCMKCNHSYEMSERQYHREMQVKAQANPSLMMAPLLTCQKCSQDAVVRAIKCEKCGEVFREGAVRDDFPDRCPKCKHSHVEATRKARQSQQQ